MKSFINLIIFISTFSCFAQGPATFTLSSKIRITPGDTTVLSSFKHSSHSIPMSKSGELNVKLIDNPGYYYLLGLGPLYLRDGMSITLSKSGSDTLFTGIGSIENNIILQLRKLEKVSFPQEGLNLKSTFNRMELPSFMSYIEDYKSKALEILNRQQLDPSFKTTQIDFIEYNIKYYAENYRRRYGIDPAKEKEYFLAAKKLSLESITSPSQIMTKLMPYLEAMHTKRLSREDRNSVDSLIWTTFDINNDELYNYSFKYREMVLQRLNMLSQAERIKSPYKGRTQADNEELKMDVINKEITSLLIKEHLLFTSAKVGLSKTEDIDNFFNKYKNLAKDSIYIKQITTIYDRKKSTKPGEPSPSFSFADVNGKQVDLKSLRGNYVYIDIWATWCVPCLKEIPALLELEKKYHSKAIKFVSISVDKQADKSKWLNSLKSYKLKGIQLLADKDFKSDFIKAYGVDAIPRFIIIDPEGKIVSPNALRPSNPKTASMLNDLLNKI